MRRTFNIGIILTSILVLSAFVVKAQYVLKEADVQFDLYNYDKAIVLYTEAYQKKKTLKATERLAESYRLMQDYKQAESWYAILIATDGAEPEAFRWYAEMLKNNAKYGQTIISPFPPSTCFLLLLVWGG